MKKCIVQGFTEIFLIMVRDITFCRMNDCVLKTYEFNKYTIRLKMQELRMVDIVFYVITFVSVYLIN